MTDFKPLHGGSWFNDSDYCRSAFRYGIVPVLRDYYIGFRIVCKKEYAPNSQITKKCYAAPSGKAASSNE